MEQKHTEQNVQHSDGQQDTGNHKVPGTPESHGADRFGGTRKGAENVEGVNRDQKSESVETGTDVSKVSGLDEVNASEKSTSSGETGGLTERTPERDERGRL
jgi:hypothetical protein